MPSPPPCPLIPHNQEQRSLCASPHLGLGLGLGLGLLVLVLASFLVHISIKDLDVIVQVQPQFTDTPDPHAEENPSLHTCRCGQSLSNMIGCVKEHLGDQRPHTCVLQLVNVIYDNEKKPQGQITTSNGGHHHTHGQRSNNATSLSRRSPRKEWIDPI